MTTVYSDLLYVFYCNGLCLLVPQKCPHTYHYPVVTNTIPPASSSSSWSLPSCWPQGVIVAHFDYRRSFLLHHLLLSILHSFFYLPSTGTSLIQLSLVCTWNAFDGSRLHRIMLMPGIRYLAFKFLSNMASTWNLEYFLPWYTLHLVPVICGEPVYLSLNISQMCSATGNIYLKKS